MKKFYTCILLSSLYHFCSAQWQLSLTLKENESIADMSSPSDNTAWLITTAFYIYTTKDGGDHWERTKARGLDEDIYVLQLYATDAATAFLSVNTGFTGVGPGIIYKTTDSGKHWSKVFSHRGNCEIQLAMFNKNKGIMGCSYSSFNGSIPSGDALFRTEDGGNTWNRDTTIGSPHFTSNLTVKDRQVGIANFKNFNYSADRGNTWSKLKLPDNASTEITQFEDSSYAVTRTGSGTLVNVKLPGTGNWVVSDGTSNRLISCMVLDGAECWLGEAFDALENYYSSDSAKTFTPFIADPNNGFLFLVKARKGRTLYGGTPPFGIARVWINKRSENP